MFTGIIQEQVTIKAFRWAQDNKSCLIKIATSHPDRRLWKQGDSIALDGACLTIVQLEHGGQSTELSFEVSRETLARSHWGNSLKPEQALAPGVTLHLEPALKIGDALGGHMISGHVEDFATLEKKQLDGAFAEFIFSVARGSSVSGFLIPKGSVAIDGVSLTVNEVWDEPGKTFFKVYLIPHTLEKCHFGQLEPNSRVNIESDLLARHYCRYQDFKANVATENELPRGEARLWS